MMELLGAIHLFYEAFVAPLGERTHGICVCQSSWQTLYLANGDKVLYFYAESGVYVFDRRCDTYTISRGSSAIIAWTRAMGVVR